MQVLHVDDPDPMSPLQTLVDMLACQGIKKVGLAVHMGCMVPIVCVGPHAAG